MQRVKDDEDDSGADSQSCFALPNPKYVSLNENGKKKSFAQTFVKLFSSFINC